MIGIRNELTERNWLKEKLYKLNETLWFIITNQFFLCVKERIDNQNLLDETFLLMFLMWYCLNTISCKCKLICSAGVKWSSNHCAPNGWNHFRLNMFVSIYFPYISNCFFSWLFSLPSIQYILRLILHNHACMKEWLNVQTTK